jgi:hypothetical protein
MILKVLLKHGEVLELMQRIRSGADHWADTEVETYGSARNASLIVKDRSTGARTRLGKLVLQEAYATAMSRVTDIAAHGSAGPQNLTPRAADAILQFALFQRIRYPFPE